MTRIGGAPGSAGPPSSPPTEATQQTSQTQQASQTQQSQSSQQSQGATNVPSAPPQTPPKGGGGPGPAAERKLEETMRARKLHTDLDGTGRVTQGPVSSETIDVTRDPSFQALPEATRNRMMQDVSANPTAAGQLQQIVNNPLYNDMSAEQRTKMLNVFAHADANGRESLPTLMNRQVVIGSGDPPQTMPALLSGDNTRNQTTLLDNLNTMANQPLHAGLASRRGELLGRTIQETAEPTWRVDQGVTGTCAPTTVQAHLLRHSPSEYARMMSGLASPSRSVQLADGTRMDAATNDTANPPTITSGTPPNTNTVPDPRSLTERMFQSAVKQHGERANPPIGQGPGYNLDANLAPSGMWDNKTGHVMSAIYNRPFEWHPPGGQGINNASSNPATQAAMRTALFAQVNSQIQSGQGPVPVHVVWGNPGTTHALHELNVERIENGRVYFRNPWGSRDPGSGQLNAVPNYHDGQSIAGPPPRTVEDSQSGLESMTVAQFQALINGATIGPPVGGA